MMRGEKGNFRCEEGNQRSKKLRLLSETDEELGLAELWTRPQTNFSARQTTSRT